MNPTAPAPKTSKRPSLSNIATLLMATTLVGQVLGILRTKLINANFPSTGHHSADAFFAAFSVPDFFFFTLAAGALGVAFIPVLTDRLYSGSRKSMWELSASLMNFLALIMAGVGVIMFVFAQPLITHIVAPGLARDPQQLHTAVTIMRFLAFNPLLFTISGILTSVQQTLGRFFFYAIAPLFYNLSIIVSAIVFSTSNHHQGGPGHLGLVGLGVGALIGCVLQLLVIIAGLVRTGFTWQPWIAWRNTGFRMVLRNLPPRSLDQGMDQIEDIVETHLASGLGSGSITYFNNAYVLSTAPILLVGTAISTAAFPRLNARLSQNRPDLFRRDFLMILRAMIWISAPLIVVCFFCRGYLARLIYTRGNLAIADIFGFLVVAIFFRILYAIMSRWFYAQKDTKTPLLVSIFTIALNVVLAYTLSRPSNYGVEGLALAQSIVAAVEVFVLAVIMLWRDHSLFDRHFWGGVWRILSVTGFSMVAGFIMISFYPLGINDRGFITLGSKLAFISLVVFGVHLVVSALFDLEEAKPVFARLKRLALKPIKFDAQ
ncbi:MAG TPA: murein biosynthesis integral membrane protein MurJ [Candidatus Saccharimonadales bacterium]|nr:murein biosynthesis integral membrane protein MurJ [Candidatus Saccharimonadales bacterium]